MARWGVVIWNRENIRIELKFKYMDLILNWFKGLRSEIQSILISSVTSLFIFIIGGLVKGLYDRYSLNYKIKREYYYEQRKKIKQILAETKTPLIKSAEDLNFRLLNLNKNINEKWHNIEECEWTHDNKYYLRSFTYRLLSFIYWVLRAEDSIYSFDLKQADKEDALYLKYIKTLKHFFCERELLDDLNYQKSGK